MSETQSGEQYEVHPERVVDELEEKVLGEQTDQSRNEDEGTRAAIEQDIDAQQMSEGAEADAAPGATD